MAAEHHDSIRAYYRAFRDKDRGTLERILTDGFRHASPMGEFNGRDAMLDAIWPGVEGCADLPRAGELEILGEHPGFVVRYQHEGSSGGRFAEFFRFAGDKIAEIEVYMGVGACPPLTPPPGAM